MVNKHSFHFVLSATIKVSVCEDRSMLINIVHNKTLEYDRVVFHHLLSMYEIGL